MTQAQEQLANTGETASSALATCSSPEQALRPFVVTWDTTEQAEFVAQGQRSLMVVKLEGCKLELLVGCQIPGEYRFQSTPEGMQSLTVASQAELGAKLPLAVLQLGGHVKQGNALSLRYFVRGVSFATAASLYRGDLKQGCEGATHFVQNYVVGAYELGESASSSAGASAGIGPVGAGGETTKTASSLFRGGAMSECKAGGSGCQAPVRLRLLGILDQRPEFVDAEAHAAELTKPEPGKKRPPLTNKEVVRSISALKPAIAACADETPGAGTLSVKLEFSIASDGVVKVVNLTGAESNLALDGCLREVAWSARFPSAADEDGLRIVKYPFTVTWQPP